MVKPFIWCTFFCLLSCFFVFHVKFFVCFFDLFVCSFLLFHGFPTIFINESTIEKIQIIYINFCLGGL